MEENYDPAQWYSKGEAWSASALLTASSQQELVRAKVLFPGANT